MGIPGWAGSGLFHEPGGLHLPQLWGRGKSGTPLPGLFQSFQGCKVPAE